MMTDQRPSILAIDDTPENLLSMGASLATEFKLQVATSGETGLALAKQSPPDLILLDVMMPEMDGYETCRRLKADPKLRMIPVIFVTALTEMDDEMAGLALGAADYLTKPVNVEIARQRIRNLLEREQLRKEVEAHRDHLEELVQARTEALSIAKEAEDCITHVAHHDALTGLLNRLSLTGRLEQALATAQREHRPLAVMFLDMDRFKTINDTLGHATGDGLLVEVARRLGEIVRNSDIVARLGGDEFVVVLTEVENAPSAARVAEKVLKSLGQSYFIGKHEVHSTPSIGLAFYPTDGDDSETLMKNADTAMYHAKSQGRNNVQFFAPEMNLFAMKRLGLEHDMREALATAQFELQYQPQLDGRTGGVVGVEALLRWHNPQDGLVLPADFIQVAEETGLILPLGEWVLDEACRQLRDWRDQGLSDLGMAVNLSALQLRSPTLLEFVALTLEKHGLTGADLELEITESAVMDDPKACIGKLKALRNLGVRLSIDNFGTGYSSLSYLKLMPIQTLKVDQSFVRNIETNLDDVVICSATIALAHNMGLIAVAEGVETEAQRDFLIAQHCDFLQGFLFSKPLGAEAVLAFFNGRIH